MTANGVLGRCTCFACCSDLEGHALYPCVSRNFISFPRGEPTSAVFSRPRFFRGTFSADRGRETLYFIPHLFQPVPTSGDTLADSRKALEVTLSALSQRLMLLSGQPILDPVIISQTADAIAKTGQALAVINTLRQSQG
jgi:hypothetical protein